MLTAVLLVAIVILVGAGVALRQRHLAFGSVGSLAVFAGLALVALCTLFVPAVFDTAADVTLQQVGVHESVVLLDSALPVEQISGVVDLLRDPKDLVERVLPGALGGLLGNRGDVVETEPLLPPPSDTGYFETNVYPVFVGLGSLVLRGVALLLALGAMVVTISISVATTAVARQRASTETAIELDARVAKLEAALESLGARETQDTEPSGPSDARSG